MKPLLLQVLQRCDGSGKVFAGACHSLASVVVYWQFSPLYFCDLSLPSFDSLLLRVTSLAIACLISRTTSRRFFSSRTFCAANLSSGELISDRLNSCRLRNYKNVSASGNRHIIYYIPIGTMYITGLWIARALEIIINVSRVLQRRLYIIAGVSGYISHEEGVI